MLNDAGSLLNGAALGSAGSIRTVALWTRGASCSAVQDAGAIFATQARALRSVVAASADAAGTLTVYRRLRGTVSASATASGVATTWRLLSSSASASATATAAIKAFIPVDLVSTASCSAIASSRIYRAVTVAAAGNCSAAGSAFLTTKGKVVVAMSGVGTCASIRSLIVANRPLKSTSQHVCVAFSQTRRMRKLLSQGQCQAFAVSKFALPRNEDYAPEDRRAVIQGGDRLMFCSGD